MRVKNAQNFSAYFYEVLTRQVDISSVDGRAKLVELARPQLNKITPGVLRQMMVDELASLASIPPSRLDGLLQDKPVATAPSTSPGKRGQELTLVRKAILLLLNDPSLAQRAEQRDSFRTLPLPGMPLLCDVLDLLSLNPQLTAGALVEHWRGQDNWRHLVKLMNAPLTIPEEGVVEEFDGVLTRFTNMGHEQRLDELFQKDQLSEQEKQELNQLLSVLKG